MSCYDVSLTSPVCTLATDLWRGYYISDEAMELDNAQAVKHKYLIPGLPMAGT